MLSWPRHSSIFVDSEGLLPYTQKLTTEPYAEPILPIININPFHQVLTVFCNHEYDLRNVRITSSENQWCRYTVFV